MSKQFFTKYLPVEGKVEIGDYFIDTGVMSNGTLVGKRANKKGVYDYQKVKLFLCSRDIQVGDKFFDNKGYEYIYQEEDFEESYFESGLAYKVIGEISPDAVWVKEGDEFDDENIKLVAAIGSSRENASALTIPDKKKYPEALHNEHYVRNMRGFQYMLVDIKCPTCDRFHYN